jgi:hypothetical protein
MFEDLTLKDTDEAYGDRSDAEAIEELIRTQRVRSEYGEYRQILLTEDIDDGQCRLGR